ncbi:NAD(P)/FAD-dependent oxidoreductase [Salinibacterium amurskyense]|uniref:dihydrolipoyl dehydrogenase family protein n=1 Tax=Salinibacterium amurskyense TaxID=205941 RepID=UPI00311FBA80
MTENNWDVIVIGAGAVGENVADRAVQGGLSVVLVESELVGGECSYWACMPSKALIRSGLALRAVEKLPGAAEAVTGGINVEALLARRNSFTSNWDDAGQVKWVKKAGIGLERGHARLAGPKTVEVTADDGTVTTLTANHAVVVSTGSDPQLPGIPGLVETQPWTPREATAVKVVPESLAIIGGGVVGVEMATAYLDLGAEVTLFARSGLLNGQEDFAGEMVEKALKERGVTIVRTSPTRVERTADGVVIETPEGSFTASEILIATGRAARTNDIGLETVGLTPGDWIRVDDTMLVPDTDWLYAVGDVNHRALLTHQGKYQARAAGDVIAARAKGETVDDAPWGAHVATADHGAVPQVTFSDPEVASVGVMSHDAEKQGIDAQVVDYNIGWVAGASLQADGYEGQARLVIDRERQVIIGATFVGQDVAELLHSATIAIVGEVPIARLWHAVPSYPTISEVWLRLLETIGRP